MAINHVTGVAPRGSWERLRWPLLGSVVLALLAVGAVALAARLASDIDGSTAKTFTVPASESRWLPQPLTYILVNSQEEQRAVEVTFDQNRGGEKALVEPPAGEIRFIVVTNKVEEDQAYAEIRLMQQTPGSDGVRVVDLR